MALHHPLALATEGEPRPVDRAVRRVLRLAVRRAGAPIAADQVVGHALGAVFGIGGQLLLPQSIVMNGAVVGLAIAAMATLRMCIPPAQPRSRPMPRPRDGASYFCRSCR